MSAALAPFPFPKPLRGDLKELQGTWIPEPSKKLSDEYIQLWGKPPPKESVEINGVRVRQFRDGKPLPNEWRITLNENGTPKTFTLGRVPSPPPELQFFNGPIRGTYILEGDRLSIRFDKADGMAVLQRKNH
jgi:hypothetical protein